MRDAHIMHQAADDGDLLANQLPRFAMIYEWLAESVTPRALQLWTFLWLHRNGETGECFPSRATLAKQMRCTAPTVDTAMKELVAAGAISKRDRFAGGRQTSNVYTLMVKPKTQPGAKSALPPPAKSALPQELEEEGTRTPTPSELDAASASSREIAIDNRTEGQRLVAYFVDQARERGVSPPKRIAGQMGRYIKQLLDDGEPPERIEAGINLMLDKGLANAALLAQFVMEAALPPPRRRREPTAVEMLLASARQAEEEER